MLFRSGYPDLASGWVNANYQVVRWNIYTDFVQGGPWNQPVWSILTPVIEKNVDKHIDVVARVLLSGELGVDDKNSIKNAVHKTFGINPNFDKSSKQISAFISRLIFQLPVWSLR